MRNPLTNLYNAFRAGLGETRLRHHINYDDRFNRIDQDLTAIKLAVVLIGCGVLVLLVKSFW